MVVKYKQVFQTLWITNKGFLIPLGTFFLLGIYPLYRWDKVTLALIINQWHHPCLDYFFTYFTWLGSGITYGMLLIGLAGIQDSRRKIIIGGGSFSLMSLMIQSMKRLFFADCLRPIALTPPHITPYIVAIPHRSMSFPSGHAGTIFVAVCFLYFINTQKKGWYSYLLITIALLTAYSRLYLYQHFYIDVYIGALSGVAATLTVYPLFMQWEIPPWLDKTIDQWTFWKRN